MIVFRWKLIEFDLFRRGFIMIKEIDIDGIDVKKIRKLAEEYYRSGDFFVQKLLLRL